MYYLALVLIVFGSFTLGALVVYVRFYDRNNQIRNKYLHELKENYNLELQNKWLRESMQKQMF